MAEEQKIFPLEKILTISATEYAKMKNTPITDYIPIGVHRQASMYITEAFAKEVPSNAEVVVNYRVELAVRDIHVASGTALIRK